MRIASIDIGTNSVLLTIAECKGGAIEAIHEAATITRIGEGLGQSGRFSPKAMNHTLKTLKKYADTCNRNKIEHIYAIGTAAMRMAKNSVEFITLAREECGIAIEVISGEKEARLGFEACRRDFGDEILVADIGGGSTEFTSLNHNGELTFSSTSLGCVTLHEKYGKSDPINDTDYNNMLTVITSELRCLAPVTAKTLVATAGTATTLVAMKLGLKKYNHPEVHGYILAMDDLQNLIEGLKVRNIRARKGIAGLEPKRADVILPGALILRAIMQKYGFDEVTVSDRGIRWGLLYEKLG